MQYQGTALQHQEVFRGWRKPRSVRFMTIATLLVMSVIFCIFLLAAYIGHNQAVA